jgi:UDP-N-acetylmuramate dehydrogenase
MRLATGETATVRYEPHTGAGGRPIGRGAAATLAANPPRYAEPVRTPDPAPTLADLTTLRVGGPADAYVVAETEADLIDAVRSADDAGVPLLVIGGGSNLLVADVGFGGAVVHDGRQDALGWPDDEATRVSPGMPAEVSVTMPAGAPWDALVAATVEHGWAGLEALSGIPGTVGAAPVQNIGAYGAEVAETLTRVRVWDRATCQVRDLAAAELGFGYRTSIIKRSMVDGPVDGLGDDPRAPWFPTPRYVVLDVTFTLVADTQSAPVRYAELAAALGVAIGDRAPAREVRTAVLALRARKAMLAGDGDYDRWSAGSFFTNPILAPADALRLPPDAPRYPAPEGVKVSAAWLIEHAGFARGFGVHGPDSAARLSTVHTLALTNRGSAAAADLIELARVVQNGVYQMYNIRLDPEPVLVGVAL